MFIDAALRVAGMLTPTEVNLMLYETKPQIVRAYVIIGKKTRTLEGRIHVKR